MTKVVLSERTEKGVHGGEEQQLEVITIGFTPYIGMKWWFNEELYHVVDICVQHRQNKKFPLDMYEIYLEVLIERM